MKGIKILERVLVTIPIMIGVALIVFAFMRLTPGDPIDLMMGLDGHASQAEIELLQDEFHLNKPLHVQLQYFLNDLSRGDLGTSIKKREPVNDLIVRALPATIELAAGAVLFALVIAIPIGLFSAVKQNSIIDRLSMAGAFLGISMPAFWLGIVLIMIFAVNLGWLEPYGRIGYDIELTRITGFYTIDSLLTGNFQAFTSAVKHLILPSIALGATMAAIVARVMRSSMLEVLRNDYVRLARAKGLNEFTVVVVHAMRNALIPTVTVIGLEAGALLGGNMIIESVFGWPGLGRLAVEAIFNRDYPLIQGVVMFYAFTFVIVNLIVDVLYTYINPKINL